MNVKLYRIRLLPRYSSGWPREDVFVSENPGYWTSRHEEKKPGKWSYKCAMDVVQIWKRHGWEYFLEEVQDER